MTIHDPIASIAADTRGRARSGSADGVLEINADRSPDERGTLVIVNTGDRPVQIGSHLHLPDANAAWSSTARRRRGSGSTSRRARRGGSSPARPARCRIVALRGRRVVPGLQIRQSEVRPMAELTRREHAALYGPTVGRPGPARRHRPVDRGRARTSPSVARRPSSAAASRSASRWPRARRPAPRGARHRHHQRRGPRPLGRRQGRRRPPGRPDRRARPGRQPRHRRRRAPGPRDRPVDRRHLGRGPDPDRGRHRRARPLPVDLAGARGARHRHHHRRRRRHRTVRGLPGHDGHARRLAPADGAPGPRPPARSTSC